MKLRVIAGVAVVLALAAGVGMYVRNGGTKELGVAGFTGKAPTIRNERAITAPDSAGVPVSADGMNAPGAPAFASDLPLPVQNLSSEVPIGPSVIKTASLTVEVPKGDFDARYEQASLVATRHGGYVGSSANALAEKSHSATIELRIPATEFERALADLRKLGKVTSESTSGQDVTAEFVDLQARLRNWEAQERVLLGLMAKAGTIDESIRVERNLSDVQLNIERIRGQLRLLSDQTDYGTITLQLDEAGATVVKHGRSTVGQAWTDAIGGFLNVVAATIVGLGYLIPIGLLLLIALLLRRWLKPRAVEVPTA